MEITRQEQLLDLVGDVYAAAMAPETWPAVVGRIKAASHSDVINLFLGSPGLLNPPTVNHCTLSGELRDSFVEHYYQVDPWAKISLHRPIPPHVERGREVIPHAELIATEYYNDWMAKAGFLDSFAVQLDGDPRRQFSGLGGMRRADRGDYQPEDLELLQTLVPHMRQAAAIDRQLQAAVTPTWALEHALDHFDTGVIVIDRDGTVARTNRAADEIIASADGLSIGRDGLSAAHPSDSRRLCELLAASMKTSLGLHTEAGSWMMLRRPSGRRPYCVLLSPIGVLGASEEAAPGAAVIFVGDPDRRPTLPTDVLQQLWKLTPAEARLTAGLASGLDLKEAAEQLEIAVSTARQYLKRIFAKTDTHRQAELVVLVARSLAPLRCAGVGESQ